jgi:hypothetical protein
VHVAERLQGQAGPDMGSAEADAARAAARTEMLRRAEEAAAVGQAFFSAANIQRILSPLHYAMLLLWSMVEQLMQIAVTRSFTEAPCRYADAADCIDHLTMGSTSAADPVRTAGLGQAPQPVLAAGGRRRDIRGSCSRAPVFRVCS